MNPSKCTFFVGRRTGGILVLKDLNATKSEEMEDPELFFDSTMKPALPDKKIIFQCSDYHEPSKSLLRVARRMFQRTSIQEEDLSSVSAQDTHNSEISSIGTVSRDREEQEAEEGIELEAVDEIVDQPPIDFVVVPSPAVEDDAMSCLDEFPDAEEGLDRSHEEGSKEAAVASMRENESAGTPSTSSAQGNFEDEEENMSVPTRNADESGVDSKLTEDGVGEKIHRQSVFSPEASEGREGFCMMDQGEDSEEDHSLFQNSTQKGKEKPKQVIGGASQCFTSPTNVNEIASSDSIVSQCKGKKKATTGRTSKSKKKGRQSKSKRKTNPYQTIFSPKGIPLPRTFRHVPVSDLKPRSPPRDFTLRRSHRARVSPLKHWKGEKAVYGPNDFGENYDGVRNMSVIHGYEKANPTPYKRRVVRGVKRGCDNEEEFDSSKIRKKYNVNDGNSARLWDIGSQEIRKMRVVSYLDQRSFQPIPGARTRTNSGTVALGLEVLDNTEVPSGVTDNMAPSNFSLGSLILPPGAIKDPNCVGRTVRLFTIVKCQPKSIEIAYGDPDKESTEWNPKLACRFFLSIGDNIQVPSGAIYRMENHSKSQEALISWTTVNLDS